MSKNRRIMKRKYENRNFCFLSFLKTRLASCSSFYHPAFRSFLNVRKSGFYLRTLFHFMLFLKCQKAWAKKISCGSYSVTGSYLWKSLDRWFFAIKTFEFGLQLVLLRAKFLDCYFSRTSILTINFLEFLTHYTWRLKGTNCFLQLKVFIFNVFFSYRKWSTKRIETEMVK